MAGGEGGEATGPPIGLGRCRGHNPPVLGQGINSRKFSPLSLLRVCCHELPQGQGGAGACRRGAVVGGKPPFGRIKPRECVRDGGCSAIAERRRGWRRSVVCWAEMGVPGCERLRRCRFPVVLRKGLQSNFSELLVITVRRRKNIAVKLVSFVWGRGHIAPLPQWLQGAWSVDETHHSDSRAAPLCHHSSYFVRTLETGLIDILFLNSICPKRSPANDQRALTSPFELAVSPVDRVSSTVHTHPTPTPPSPLTPSLSQRT